MKKLIPFLLMATASFSQAQERDVLSIIEANFAAADADGSTGLDATEFRSLIDANAISKIGRAATVKRFGAYDRAFNIADKDGDGFVTWTEIMENRSR